MRSKDCAGGWEQPGIDQGHCTSLRSTTHAAGIPAPSEPPPPPELQSSAGSGTGISPLFACMLAALRLWPWKDLALCFPSGIRHAPS